MDLFIINENYQIPVVALAFDSDDRCIIYNLFIKSEIETFGIYIPPGLRAQYSNKTYLPLPDLKKATELERTAFKKAFMEIYFPKHLSNNKFVKTYSERGQKK